MISILGPQHFYVEGDARWNPDVPLELPVTETIEEFDCWLITTTDFWTVNFDGYYEKTDNIAAEITENNLILSAKNGWQEERKLTSLKLNYVTDVPANIKVTIVNEFGEIVAFSGYEEVPYESGFAITFDPVRVGYISITSDTSCEITITDIIVKEKIEPKKVLQSTTIVDRDIEPTIVEDFDYELPPIASSLRVPDPIIQDLLSDLTVNARSISFDQIKSNLKTFIQNNYADVLKDWYRSSTITIAVDLAATIGTYLATKWLFARIEHFRDFCKLESSLIEHSFNRTLLIPPGRAAEVIIVFKNTSQETINIDKADVIGVCGEYSVYALDAVSVDFGKTGKVTGVVGNMHIKEEQHAGLQEFSHLEYDKPEELIGIQLEEFVVNGEPVELFSDRSFFDTPGNEILLRRLAYTSIKIYFGNGAIGWWKTGIANTRYRFLSYKKAVNNVIGNLTPLVEMDVISTDWTKASTGLDIEKIRAISHYYPVDGIIRHDVHYEGVILKYYDPYILDVYSCNSDPMQEVYIIKRPDWYKDHHTGKIKQLVEHRRGPAIPVRYHLFTVDDGLEFKPIFKIHQAYYSEDLVEKIKKQLKTWCFRFMKDYVTIDSSVLSAFISSELKVPIVSGSEIKLSLKPHQFLKTVAPIIKIVK